MRLICHCRRWCGMRRRAVRAVGRRLCGCGGARCVGVVGVIESRKLNWASGFGWWWLVVVVLKQHAVEHVVRRAKGEGPRNI